MGHTFLFRGEPKGRADSLDWWLSILSADAMLLSELAGGSRSLAKLSESLETLAVERRRKGRERYRESVAEMIERLLHCQSAMMTETRGKVCVYPSLVRHVEKKAQYALRLAGRTDMPLVCGASAMKEVSFALSLVCDVAHLCPQYLDPSEQMMMKRAREMGEMLDDSPARALCYGMGRCRYEEFLAETDETVVMYRRFLKVLGMRAEEGRLLAAFPPSFLVWADGTCALVHRLLKRLASGKSVIEVAEEEEEEMAEGATRTMPLIPMTILAEHSEQEEAVRETVSEVREETDAVHEEGSAVGESESEVREEPTVEAEVLSVPEKIYAKASDYKNIIEKAVKKRREHGARTPRPLGKGR